MHVMLFVNFGIVLALLAPALASWMQLPDGVVRVDYGWASWVLSAMSAVSLGWSARDGLRAMRLMRKIQGG